MGADGENHIRAGKLNMVDLAGSERQAKTGATVLYFRFKFQIAFIEKFFLYRDNVSKKRPKLISHCQRWAT